MAASAMDDMADRFADRGVTSVFIYTREAHPGENYRPHRSMDEKRAHARAFVKHSAVRRRILVDDLEGSCHKAYGMLPNMTYIVGRGQILYRANWTNARDVEDALEQSIFGLEHRRERDLRSMFTERVAWRDTDHDAFRKGLERTGPQAVTDFYGKE
jgi:hypothetical protein